MAFTLDTVVPWGRSFEEYVDMFALSEADLKRRIVGCGDGPAAFNSVLTRRGGQVVSIDPLYRFGADEIRERIRATFETIMAETRRNAHEFVWRHIASVEALGQVRMGAMEAFLEDYPRGRRQGRYLAGELPHLPLPSRSFDLALCSHYLFLYSAQLSADFHIAAIEEMARLAREVRVFPLLELGAVRSRHVERVVAALGRMGHRAAIEPVGYEFQRGGNEMLRVVRARRAD